MTASLLDFRFVVLLSAVGLVRAVWPRKHYISLVAVSSAVLVGLASPATFITISLLTLCYLYPVHRLCVRAKRSTDSRLGKLILPLSIGGLVALLLLFKVYKHFTIPWFGGPKIQHEILALIGFSYFTFRAISFLHIQSIIAIDERNPLAILCYTLFPPTITSGPIQRYQDFRQQLAAPLPLTAPLIWDAAYRITRGYFRKVVLAFVFDQISSRLLGAAQLTVGTSFLVIVVLYLYFYFDFAGYSDIAIGFGLLLGIKVPENFRKPFLATNVSEFWRNWHITLVDWFRDNVFIPLGGMQTNRHRAAALAFLIMVLCGLWHGLTLSLLIWGAWHGFLLFTEAMTGSKPVPPSRRHGLTYWSRVLWTNARVAAASILFCRTPRTFLRSSTVLSGFELC